MSASEKELEILLDLSKIQIQSTRLPVVEPDVFTGNIMIKPPMKTKVFLVSVTSPMSPGSI